MKVLLIPGLGYTHRIFERLALGNLDLNYINWIAPLPKESLQDYALRLFQPYTNIQEEIVIIGHSLGGMVAQEIASVHSIKTIFLMGSIQSRKELPFTFKMVKLFHLDIFFNKTISLKTVKYWGKNHGFTQVEDIELFKDMVSQQSNRYLRWALRSLSSWQTPQVPIDTKLVQIHGTNDQTFPYKNILNPDHVIEQGSHIFVYKKAKQASTILLSYLN